MFSSENTTETLANIKVIGVGGGGNNAVNRMISAGLKVLNLLLVTAMRKPCCFQKHQTGYK